MRKRFLTIILTSMILVYTVALSLAAPNILTNALIPGAIRIGISAPGNKHLAASSSRDESLPQHHSRR